MVSYSKACNDMVNGIIDNCLLNHKEPDGNCFICMAAKKTKHYETVDYHMTDGRPCKVTIPEGYEGRIVDGVLQVLPSNTTAAAPSSQTPDKN